MADPHKHRSRLRQEYLYAMQDQAKVPRCENVGAFPFATHYMQRNLPVLVRGLTVEWRACRDWVSNNTGKAARREKHSASVLPHSLNEGEQPEKKGEEKERKEGEGDKQKEKDHEQEKPKVKKLGESITAASMTRKSGPTHTPDFDFLSRTFGEAKVQVAKCDTREYSDQERSEMSFARFLLDWSQGKGGTRYCKDFHLVQAFPEYKAYTTPQLFSDDWLNDFCVAQQEQDYRFVYAGPAFSWTPLHRDVFKSYSWSSNVTGIKLWFLFSPEASTGLWNTRHDSVVYNVLQDDVDATEFPGFRGAFSQVLRVIQHPGETVFVPSGWYHQVHNLEDTVSINHNWVNGWNIHGMWEHMRDEYREIVKCLAGYNFDRDEEQSEEAIDFEQAEQLLQAHAGINMGGFRAFLVWCIHTRLSKLLGLVKERQTLSVPSANPVADANIFSLACSLLSLPPPLFFFNVIFIFASPLLSLNTIIIIILINLITSTNTITGRNSNAEVIASYYDSRRLFSGCPCLLPGRRNRFLKMPNRSKTFSGLSDHYIFLDKAPQRLEQAPRNASSSRPWLCG